MPWEFIATGSGYNVPLRRFDAIEPAHDAVIFMMPALGIGAGFYRRFCENLAALGTQTVLMEQRGYGESALRAGAGTNFGFKDFLEDDIPAALDWVARQYPDRPIYLAGHSLGGHLATMYLGLRPEAAAGLVMIACGSPYLRNFGFKNRLQLRYLDACIRPACALLGYFPGKQIGFGGRDAPQVMMDWRHMLWHNRYAPKGISTNIDEAIPLYTGRVLSLLYDRDIYAPQAANDAVLQKLRNATVTRRLIDNQMQGSITDHYQWARSPQATADIIRHWLET